MRAGRGTLADEDALAGQLCTKPHYQRKFFDAIFIANP